MKRHVLLLFCLACVVPAAVADIRTPEQAAAIAADCLQEAAAVNTVRHSPASGKEMVLFRTLYKTDLDLDESPSIPNPAPGRNTHIDNDETEPALYMFNNDTEGFVIVAADTRARDVLGYSVTGTLTDEDIAPGFMWLMERFVEEISSLTDTDDAMASPSRSPQAPQTVTPIEPLLGKIEWGQGTPYNNLCPIDNYDNTRCVTGCVATAAAQIMCYWQWPVRGTGSHSYTWTNQLNNSTKTLSFNYGSTTFDWANMLSSYKGDYTTAQANAVARLMYACGVSVDMKYGGNSTAGSGSVTDNMATAMTTYFGYQYVGNLGSSYNSIDNEDIYSGTTTYAEAYGQYFNDDLENGRPILMSGSSSAGGHAFVCDGRDADGYFHINWGWTGSSNCYTPLTAIRPGYPKHNDLLFKTRMFATYGMRPNNTCINTTTNTTASETEDNLPYVWRGQNITETGVYEDVVTDAETGCTTTYVLYFTVRPAGTDGMCGDNLFYAYNASTHTLTITGTGDMWEYDFISTPGRKTPWYPYASDITSVELPEGMTSMSAFAFVYCSGLTSITIPSTIASVGAQPFFGCTSLRSVVWNAANCNSATARNLAPFYDVRGQITSFTFGEGVETIPGALCYGMKKLTSCVLPASLVDINIWAFSGCSGLTGITLPENVEYLGRQAFQNCTGLTSITIPEKVELMMDSVFSGCTSLTSVQWNATACAINGTAARYYPFYYIRSQITSFTIGRNVTSLPYGCCRSLTRLTRITIPSGLTSVSSRCFQDCSSLATFVFEGSTPPSFASYAFSNLPSGAVAYVPCGSTAAYEASSLPFSEYRSLCGYCEENNGTDLEWEFDNGLLAITGEGNMETYANEGDMPWHIVSDRIEAVSLTDQANQQPLLTWLAAQGTKNITINRTLYADGYLNTLCLPFTLTPSEVAKYLPHAELYAFTSAQAVTGELQIRLEAVNSITAGVPYLVRFPASDPDIVNPTFTGVEITATMGQTAGAGEVTFNGVLAPKDMVANNTDQLMVGADDELFWADVNDYMKGFRAYFQISAAQSSPIRRGMPARVVMQPQTPTDAEQTSVSQRAEKVIRDGQMIIRANGNEYNAQGQKM
ncbi:MAG: C10 family peptidase [Paludibacteraceae bacterium]|nr:C10 family peptidase [Paludibacteraceae bacterium]